jgi:hypothetical protein
MTRRKFVKQQKQFSTKIIIAITVAINLGLAGAIQLTPIVTKMVVSFWNAPIEIKKSTVTAPYSDALEKAFTALKLSKEPKPNNLPKQKNS